MQRSSRLRKTIAAFAVTTASLVGTALVAGPIAGAATQARAPSPRTAFSLKHHLWVDRARVDSIGTSSFTVLTGRRTLTINVLPATVFRIDGQTGVFGDLSVDAEVRVLGTYGGSSGTLDAAVVDILPSAKVVAWGTVQSIGSSSFVLWRLRGGMWTVDFTDSTQFRYAANQSSPNDESAANSSDLAVGDSVRVFATRTTTAGTLNALVVVILPQTLAHVSGYITTIGPDSFVVLHGNATVTVDVGDSTHYRIPGTPNATFGDLAVGDPVSVGGTSNSTDGTIDADIVTVVTKQPHAIFGEVSSVGTGEFTVVHAQTNLNVDVTSVTQFFQLGTGSVSFGALATGDRVLVSMTYTRTAGTVDANWVLILQPKTPPPPVQG
jgi:hypothetical protein